MPTTLAVALSLGLVLVASCSESEPDDGATDTSLVEGGAGASTDSGSTSSGDGGADTGWTEKEREAACAAARDEGYADAIAAIGDCTCDEHEFFESWSLDDYTTQFERDCYHGNWSEIFAQYCTENCTDDKSYVEFEVCCRGLMDWAGEQYNSYDTCDD